MSQEPLLTSVVGSHARPSWFVSGIDGCRARRVRPDRPRGDARRRGGPRPARPGGGRHRHRQRRRDAAGRLLHRRVLPARDGRPRPATGATAGGRGARPAAPLRGPRADRRARRPRRRRRVSLRGHARDPAVEGDPPRAVHAVRPADLRAGPGLRDAERRRGGVRADPAGGAGRPRRRRRGLHPDRRAVAGDPSGGPGGFLGLVQRGGGTGGRARPARGASLLRQLPRAPAGAADVPSRPRGDARLPGRRAGARVRQPRDGRGRDPRRDRRRRPARRRRRDRRQELVCRDRGRRRRADRRGARSGRPGRRAHARPGLRLQPDPARPDPGQARGHGRRPRPGARTNEGRTDERPRHHHAGHGVDRRLLHEHAPEPARPRHRPGRLFAQRGAWRGLRSALGHRGIDDRPRRRDRPSGHGRRRRRAAELPARGGDRPGRQGRQGDPVHEAARPDGGRGAPDPGHGRGGGRLRRLSRGPVLHAQDAQGDRLGALGCHRRRDVGPLARGPSRARTAPGSGTAG